MQCIPQVHKGFCETCSSPEPKVHERPTLSIPFLRGWRSLEASQKLKAAVLHPPILALPKIGLPYTLHTDTSGIQTCCFLMQEQENGGEFPIGFSSRSIYQTEQNYTVIEKECHAVVWRILMLRLTCRMLSYLNESSWCPEVKNWTYGRLQTVSSMEPPPTWIWIWVRVPSRCQAQRTRRPVAPYYQWVRGRRGWRLNNLFHHL